MSRAGRLTLAGWLRSKTSLKNLGTTYIDMILLHRPCEQTKQNCSIAPKLSNCSGPVVVKDPTAANNKLWAGL